MVVGGLFEDEVEKMLKISFETLEGVDNPTEHQRLPRSPDHQPRVPTADTFDGSESTYL